MRDRTFIRRTSLLVLMAFAMSLGAPIVEAQTSQAPTTQAPTTVAPTTSGGVAGMVATAKNSLAKLWGAWAAKPVPPGTPVNYKPTLGEAFSFFIKQGATPQQAEILANNAQATGSLSAASPSAASAPKSWISKLFGRSSSPAPEVAASSAPQASAGTKIVDKIKGGFDKLVLGGKRTADTAATGVNTGFLTVKDKLFDFNRYYELPLSDTSAIKFRGQWESTVKFTNGKWVTGEASASSKWPGGTIKSGDAIARIEDIAVGTKDGRFTESGLARGVDKIREGATSLRDKIFGSKTRTLSGEQVNELGKLEIQGHLMEQSRAIVDAQKAIQNRINELVAKSDRLQKPVPTEEIANLKKGFETLEAQKKEISNRLNKAGESKAGAVMKDAATWALYSVGITAGVNIIGQVVNGEKVDIKKAFSFVAQPSFWGGTAGGFVGSMLFQTLASSFLPPGMGIFFKVIPGFLGAALGYEVGSGLFGKGSPTNWIQTIGSTLASAGGYTLAYSLLGGAAAPGIALIGASIAAGAVANFLLGKLFNKGQPQAEVADLAPVGSAAASLPEQPAVQAAPVQTLAEPPAPAASETTPSLGMAAAAQEMKTAYNEYINNLKERKVTDARTAYDRYVKAKEALDKARETASR